MKALLCGVVGAVCSCLAVSASAEDAYLKSTGSQWVNTGYYMNARSRVEIDFQYETTPTGNLAAGLWRDGCGLAAAFWNANGKYSFILNDGGYYNYTSSVSCDTARHTAVLDAPGRGFSLRSAAGAVEWSGTIAAGKTCQNTANWPFAIFAATINAQGEANQCVSMRVYGVKIYEDNVLVRDFRPARQYDIPGFYDVVTGAFRYPSCPSQMLQYGGELMEAPDNDTSGYIASDGSQYISLGYFMNPKSRIEVDFRCPTIVTSGLYFGAWDTGSKLSTGFWVDSNYAFILNDDKYKSHRTGMAPDNVRHTAVLDVKNCRWEMRNANGTTERYASLASQCTCTNTAAWPVVIFGSARDATGVGKQKMAMRVYGVKIYEDEVLLHDYVPCLRGPSSVLYDKITGQVRSPNIALATGGTLEPVPDDPCLECTGNQGVSTGYKMTPRSRLEVDYAYTACTKAAMPFGAWDTGNGAGLAAALWLNNDTNLDYIAGNTFASHSVSDKATSRRDTVRHTAVIDFKGGMLKQISGVCTNWTKAVSVSNTANWPIGLFAGCNNADGTAFSLGARARIYGVKIYEDDELMKNLVPQLSADGQPSFRDTVSSATLPNGTLSSPLPGGTLEGATDAYVQSDGQVMLNSGYHLNTKSRVEVDFRIYDNTGSSIIFGAWNSGASIRYCFWHSGTTWQCIIGATNASPQYVTTQKTDFGRHTAIVDIYGRRLSYVTGGVTNYTCAIDKAQSQFIEGETCRDPMGIFAGYNQSMTGEMLQNNMRVYSVRIYEENELIHELLPCRRGETTGLYDVCTDDLVQRSLASMPQPKIGGCGCEGSGEAFRVLPGPTVVEPERQQELKVFAPGAVRYVWTRNGVPLAETGNAVTATWRRGGPTDVYTVAGVYLVSGAEKTGAPSTIRVDHALRGLMLLVR